MKTWRPQSEQVVGVFGPRLESQSKMKMKSKKMSQDATTLTPNLHLTLKRAAASLLSARAFTLLELLIAVAIFSMVLLAINGVFYGAMRLRTKTSRMVEASLPIQQTVAIIKRDLQGIVVPGGMLSGSLKSDTASGSMGQPGATEFYTCTGTLDVTLPWAEIQKVSYILRDPTNFTSTGGRDLMRAVTRNLLATVQDQPTEQFLMADVERVGFSYYDGTSWRDSWDSTTPDTTTGLTNNLPRAIKVQIDLAETDEELHTRTTRQNKAPVQIVVPIDVQAPTNQTQNAGGQQ